MNCISRIREKSKGNNKEKISFLLLGFGLVEMFGEEGIIEHSFLGGIHLFAVHEIDCFGIGYAHPHQNLPLLDGDSRLCQSLLYFEHVLHTFVIVSLDSMFFNYRA